MKIKDPISGFSHLLGAFISIIGTVFLLIQSENFVEFVSFLIFGLSMSFLYSSSAFYHLFGEKPEEVDVFRKIDHAMIYVLIAGTYTPFCLLALERSFGIICFISVWILATLGISTVFFKSFWSKVPRKISTFLYIAMGWLSLILIYPLSKSLPVNAIVLLFLGGFFYTVGAFVYSYKKPNISDVFGFHELFHILVLFGTMSHFWCIYLYL